jgi:opacity protein-like surface antigen
MRKFLILAIMIVACGALGFAQSSDRAKPEFYAGFSIDSVDAQINQSGVFVQDSGNRLTAYGFEFSGTGYIKGNFGIEGNLDGHFRNKTFNISSISPTGPFTTVNTDYKEFNFMGGPHVKFTTSNAKVSPFLHALVGANHSSTTGSTTGVVVNVNGTDFALKLGGGIDFGMTDHVGVRVGADYNPVFERNNNTFATGSNNTRNDFIFNVGLVFK